MKKLIYFIFFVLFLCGCATGYNKYGFFGGYEDIAYGDNVFEVMFGGNAYISMKKAKDLTLLRCAE